MKEYKVPIQPYPNDDLKAFIKYDLQKNLGTMEIETYDYYDDDYHKDDEAKIFFSLGFNVNNSWTRRITLLRGISPNKKNHTKEVYLKLRDKRKQMNIEYKNLILYFSDEFEIKELILKTIEKDIKSLGVLSLLPDMESSYQVLNATFNVGEIKRVANHFEVTTIHPASWKLWFVHYLNQPNSIFKESWNPETKEFESLDKVKDYLAERWFATWSN